MSINLERPRYDQTTYTGRAKHFLITTNPLNILATNEQLEKSKSLVDTYLQTRTLPDNLNKDDLWRAKYLMDSAYHPDTKEKMFYLGRMSAQVPVNLLITAGMLTFYKTVAGTVFFQVLNQSFGALVNYTNRSGDTPISSARLATSFTIATSSATATALLLGRVAKKMPPIYGRCVPFIAVAAANCINLPFMRSSEIMNGIQLVNEKDKKIGESPKVAKSAISQVVASRIAMAAPSMILVPVIMTKLENKYPKIKGSLAMTLGWQLLLVGIALLVATPLCCAIFPQRNSVRIDTLETEIRDKLLKDGYKESENVFYNKGL